MHTNLLLIWTEAMNENVARVRSLQSIFRSSFLISLSRRATYACLSALSPRGRPKGGYVIHTMDMGPYRNFFSLNIDRALVACPPAARARPTVVLDKYFSSGRDFLSRFGQLKPRAQLERTLVSLISWDFAFQCFFSVMQPPRAESFVT